MKNLSIFYPVYVLLAFLLQPHYCHGLPSQFAIAKGSASYTATSLRMGGYDATVGGANPSTPIQFFTLAGNTCPYAARTMITLCELGLPFDVIEVSTRPTPPDWYLNLNPRGKVPALQIPAYKNEVVYESAICNEFLCDYATMTLHQTPCMLMPDKDPSLRARIRLLNDHCDTVFLKTQFTFLMNKDGAKDDELRQAMEDALVPYENALQEGGGPFLLGQHFTLADVHVLPFILRLIISLRHFKQYELPTEKFPKLLAWFELCSQRESVQQASITNEKIIEIYTRFVDADYSFGGLNKNK